MSRTCTTSAAHRGQVLFPADPRLFRRCLRLPRPRRPCWNPCSYRWRHRLGLPAGASIPAAAPAGYPVPAAPVLSASPFPAWPGACPACRTVISCGAACRMGLSGSTDRMPMSGRQILSSSAQTSTPQPACCAHGNLSKNFFMCVRPPGKGLPPSKSLLFVQFIRMFKTSLKRTNKPHGSPRFRVGNRPAWGGYPIFNSERWTACFILRFFP